MQVIRREISVRRIVAIKRADPGIAEQHTATTVRLEAMLVRIDHDRIGVARRIVSSACFRAEVFGESEVTAISRIDVNPKSKALAQAEDFRQRVHCTSSG